MDDVTDFRIAVWTVWMNKEAILNVILKLKCRIIVLTKWIFLFFYSL